MTNTEFYTNWISNPNIESRINLITEVLDTPNIDVKSIFRINSKGEPCAVKDIMPELAKLLTLIRKYQYLETAIIDLVKLKGEYNQWAREQSLEKLLD